MKKCSCRAGEPVDEGGGMPEVQVRDLTKTFGRAAALRGDPRVLLLDEPANGLDPAGIAWLRGMLRDLADEGRTVVVASHALGEIARTADHVVIVGSGRVRFAGQLAEIGATDTAL